MKKANHELPIGRTVGRDTLLLIPTLNEVDNVKPLAGLLVEKGFGGDILWIDDGSTDGTVGELEELIRRRPNWQLLERKGKKGLGRSYQDAFQYALGTDCEFIATMDADLSHRPDDLLTLLAHRDRADAVIGSRYSTKPHGVVDWPLHRVLLSRWAGVYCRMILGYPLADWTSGFKVLSRDCLERIAREPFRSNGYAFQIELHHRIVEADLRLVEVGVTFKDRQRGKSKLRWKSIAEAVLAVWKLRFLRSASASKTA